MLDTEDATIFTNLTDLLEDMLQYSPAKRLGAGAALQKYYGNYSKEMSM